MGGRALATLAVAGVAMALVGFDHYSGLCCTWLKKRRGQRGGGVIVKLAWNVHDAPLKSVYILIQAIERLAEDSHRNDMTLIELH